MESKKKKETRKENIKKIRIYIYTEILSLGSEYRLHYARSE